MRNLIMHNEATEIQNASKATNSDNARAQCASDSEDTSNGRFIFILLQHTKSSNNLTRAKMTAGKQTDHEGNTHHHHHNYKWTTTTTKTTHH